MPKIISNWTDSWKKKADSTTNASSAIKCLQMYDFWLQVSLALKVLKAMKKVCSAVPKPMAWTFAAGGVWLDSPAA